MEETPYPKKRFHLPVILSQEEMARLIESALIPFHRTILITVCATGVRRAELANLKISDIDSQRMVVHVRGGEGRKDRDVMLSQHLLAELRQHFRRLGRKPAEWLFPGGRYFLCRRRDAPKIHRFLSQAALGAHHLQAVTDHGAAGRTCPAPTIGSGCARPGAARRQS